MFSITLDTCGKESDWMVPDFCLITSIAAQPMALC
jgi:hypothetical protein